MYILPYCQSLFAQGNRIIDL